MTAQTQSTDLHNDTAHAIEYAANGDSWTIGTGVSVTSGGNETAIHSYFNDNALFNRGNISGGIAVQFEVDNNNSLSITNDTDRHMIGTFTGIDVWGPGGTITNRGSVMGMAGDGIQIHFGDGMQIDNQHGEIFGHLHGIDWNSPTTGAKLTNSALIASDQRAVTFSGALLIDNNAGGVFRGAIDAIEANGALTLHNLGKIDGNVLCNSGTAIDFVQNQGTITGQVELGGGNDIFDGRGGTAGPVFGEAGDDKIYAGNGADVLTGGIGADTFFFTNLKAIGKGASHDTIQDFTHADQDVIDLSAIDANTHAAHNQAFHYIAAHHFNDKAGELRLSNHILSGDVNGDGKADFEILVTNVTALTAGVDIHL